METLFLFLAVSLFSASICISLSRCLSVFPSLCASFSLAVYPSFPPCVPLLCRSPSLLLCRSPSPVCDEIVMRYSPSRPPYVFSSFSFPLSPLSSFDRGSFPSASPGPFRWFPRQSTPSRGARTLKRRRTTPASSTTTRSAQCQSALPPAQGIRSAKQRRRHAECRRLEGSESYARSRKKTAADRQATRASAH